MNLSAKLGDFDNMTLFLLIWIFLRNKLHLLENNGLCMIKEKVVDKLKELDNI